MSRHLAARRLRAWALTALAGICAAGGVLSTQELDRRVQPAPGKAPPLRVPAWSRDTLANGADLIVSEKRDLPLVSFSLTFLGGSNQFEPAGREGLASLAASLLSEGTTTRSGDELSDALQLLGTSVSVSVGGESGSIAFLSTAANFAATLDLVADMLVNSTFPDPALTRLRAQRLVALRQARAQPRAVADRVFPRLLYGAAHPYGRIVTEASLDSITRADVLRFHDTYFRPGRALVTVVGDVAAADVKPLVEKRLAAWRRGGERPAFRYPAVPERPKTTIFLVDKPDAAQSTVALGHPGPPRDTPDFFALQVMNTILGGMFQSRLNANIREEKGYSYGVGSSFSFGRGPGAFRTGGDVVTEKTDAALVEFMKELRGILGERPVSDEELAVAKEALVQRLPAMFASVASINSALTTLWVQGLPDDYYERYAKSVGAVTKEDVLRVARQHVHPDRLAIVIVGDRARVEGPLQATGLAPIRLYDSEGEPVTGGDTPSPPR